jgi:hypothetical protein
VIRSKFKLHRRVFEGETPPAGQQPPAQPPKDKTFDQAAVDKIIQERLAEERKKFSKREQDLLAKLNDLDLTAKQKADLETQLEEMRVQTLSKEEQAKIAQKKKDEEWERKYKSAVEDKEKVFKTFTEEKIRRDLMDAASSVATKPFQVVALLRGDARLAEKLDESNKPTGGYETRVKFVAVKDGKNVELDLTPVEAVQAMSEDVDRFGNLFKPAQAGGLGGSPGKPMDEFMKQYRENPSSLGIKR